MQKLATRIFIIASLVFGVLGIIVVLTSPGEGSHTPPSDFNVFMAKLLLITVFIILPSFALSVASKYLNGNK